MSQKFLEGVCHALYVRRGSRISAIWKLSPKKTENNILEWLRASAFYMRFLVDPNIWDMLEPF